MASSCEKKSCFIGWKTILTVLSLLFIFYSCKNREDKITLNKDAIGKVLIEGVIRNETEIVKRLEMLSEQSKLKALIVEVDSPGGAVVPSYRLYDGIRKISDSGKPVVIVMKSVAASGGYLISVAGDYVIAHPSTITGSVGVVSYRLDPEGLMGKIGVKPLIFKTGKLKASPLPGEQVTEDVREMVNRIMLETKKQFLDLVLLRRKITDQKIIEDIADSGIYLGSEAKKIGLIDETGSIEEALKWLKENKSIDYKIQEIELKPKKRKGLIDLIKNGGNDSKIEILLKDFAEKASMQGMYLLYTE